MSTAEPPVPPTPALISVEAALAELGWLATAGDVAEHLRAHDIHGSHLHDDCPIYHYLAARTGLSDLSIGRTSWSIWRQPVVAAGRSGSSESGDLPWSVIEFIDAHDRHQAGFADLCIVDHDRTPDDALDGDDDV